FVLAQLGDRGSSALYWIGGIAAIALVVLATFIFISVRYRRCPSNRILVVFGKVGGGKASRCIHGGGTMVWPLIQDYAYLSLEPLAIEIPLEGALSQNNI